MEFTTSRRTWAQEPDCTAGFQARRHSCPYASLKYKLYSQSLARKSVSSNTEFGYLLIKKSLLHIQVLEQLIDYVYRPHNAF